MLCSPPRSRGGGFGKDDLQGVTSDFLRRIGYTFEPYACQTPNATCVVTQHPGHSPCRGAEDAGDNKHVADFLRSISSVG